MRSWSPPLRVTFLMDSGLVLADSQQDAMLMTNHRDRPEIQAALQGEVGQSLHLSDTQSIFMLHAEKQIAPNLILRLGYPIEMITRVLVYYSIGMVLYFIQRWMLKHFTQALSRQMDDIRQLLEAIRNVLLLSRAERTKEMKLETVCAERIAREVCQSLTPQAAQNDIRLSVEGTFALMAVETDIWEILYNLVSM